MSTSLEQLTAALAGRYRIERELGAGGMATVYLARDVRHDREVALKVLRPDLSAVLGGERFLNEIRITARLDHPHILTLIDSGSNEGLLWYVLPYIRGESLRVRLRREKQLGLDEALRITQQVAGALEYAHRQGVIHRDIKPENILLFEGEAMLADFGIALAVKEAGGNRLTETGLSLGTPQYMSPEQATGERQPDARSDVYSLGAVLYEMLTGEAPYSGVTAQAVIAKLLTEKPTRVRTVRDTVPEGVDTAVAKALAKIPADRFGSAADFAQAVTTAFATAPAGPARRGRGPALAIAGGVAVALGITLFLLLRGHAPPPAPPAQTTQLTATGGSWAPSLSPDGNFLAYVTEQCTGEPKKCTQSLIVQDLASGSRPTTVASDLDAVIQSRWSTDGTRIYYTAGQGSVTSLFSVPRLGGAVERLGAFWTYAVSPDSARVIAPDIAVSSDTFALVSVLKRSTGEVVDSLRVPGMMAVDARWSPDGRWLAVVTQTMPNGSRLAILSRDLKIVDHLSEPRIRAFRYSGQVRWTPGSDGLYFLAEGPGIRAFLVRRDVDPSKGRFVGEGDTVLTELRAPPGAGFDVSADGKTLVYSGGPVTRELWTLERSSARGPWKTRQILSSTAGLTGADIADDGTQIAYGVFEPSGASARVWVAPFEGGDPHSVGPPLASLTGPTYPRYIDGVLKVSFRDEHDSVHNALLPSVGGTPQPLPARLGYLAGLRDGGRLIELPAPSNPAASVFNRYGRDGALVASHPWPDSLGSPDIKVASPVNDDVYVLARVLRAGSLTARLFRFDPVSSGIVPLGELSLPLTWSGLLQEQTDGRLVYGDQPGFVAGTRMRLGYLDPATRKTDFEELPLSFTDFNVTHDGRRAVGIVDSRQTDVWMVKNFDSRRRD
jgi:Protein kinase domain/WD40-like Beta Propeller Repeat